MGTTHSTPRWIRCLQSMLTFIFVSVCLLLLAILTYFTLRKHIMPTSHLVIPISLGLPADFDPKTNAMFANSPNTYPPYLVSYVNLSDTLHNQPALDVSRHPYGVELVCYSARSYRNRQLGSFFVQLVAYSSSNQVIAEHSRMILYPYQSEIVRLARTVLFLPLSIFHLDYDRWHLKQVLIERLTTDDKSKRFLERLQLTVIPSSFQLDQCSLHLHIRELTGLVYSFINYPILAGCLSIAVLFSIYMTFYLIVTGLTLLNQMQKAELSTKKVH